MRAILRSRFGGPEVLVIREIPEPEPKDGHAVIAVKAFGLYHAEPHMRKGVGRDRRRQRHRVRGSLPDREWGHPHGGR
jgi:NADPH:quinone reductase-like Zn-dependent oxidoreductase